MEGGCGVSRCEFESRTLRMGIKRRKCPIPRCQCDCHEPLRGHEPHPNMTCVDFNRYLIPEEADFQDVLESVRVDEDVRAHA